MDLKICGIIDIALVLIAILFMFIGYKKGFLKKVLSLVGILAILAISFLYCAKLSDFLINHEIIYPGLVTKYTDKMLVALAEKNITGDMEIAEVISEYLSIPKFIARWIVDGYQSDGTAMTAEVAAGIVGAGIAKIMMTIISFFILLVGIIILIIILKVIICILRESKIVRVLDGIFGALLYFAMFVAIISFLFWILSFMMDAAWFSKAHDFLVIDMQLETDAFRLSKWIYNGNIFKRLFDLLF